MSGLGLMQALQGYQEGVKWRQQQDQYTRDEEERKILDSANGVASDAVKAAQEQVIESQRQEFITQGGDPAQFKANAKLTPDIVLAGMHARGDAIAKTGNYKLWTQNEAATAPLRTHMRQQGIADALAEYRATGDGAALARRAYPMIHDGVDIADIQQDNTGGLGMAGASQAVAQGGKVGKLYTIKLSNGQQSQLSGDQIAQMAHDAMMDPAATAKYEYEARLKALEAASKDRQIGLKGAEDRKTETMKAETQRDIATNRDQTALTVGAGHDKASRYGADQRLEGQRIAAKSRVTAAMKRAGASRDKPMTLPQIESAIKDIVGDQVMEGLQSGTRTGSAKTHVISARVDQLRRANKGMTDAEAMTQALDEAGTFDDAPGGKSAKAAGAAASAALKTPGSPTVSNWVPGAAGADDQSDDEEQ